MVPNIGAREAKSETFCLKSSLNYPSLEGSTLVPNISKESDFTLQNNNDSGLERLLAERDPRSRWHESEELLSLLAALPEHERQDPKRVSEVRRDLERQRGWERLQAKQGPPKGHQGDSSCGLARVEDMPNHGYSAGYRYGQNGGLPKTRTAK
jgi:hypothetical protein